jgi:hypothetical protein
VADFQFEAGLCGRRQDHQRIEAGKAARLGRPQPLEYDFATAKNLG